MAAEHSIGVTIVGDGEAATALESAVRLLEEFELIEEHGEPVPDVVLLVHDEQAEPREALARLREQSLVPVILATAVPSTELVHWALDAGIADVLPLPASSEGLLFAIQKAARVAYQGAQVGRGRVVTVFSPKGGSGSLSSPPILRLRARSTRRTARCSSISISSSETLRSCSA